MHQNHAFTKEREAAMMEFVRMYPFATVIAIKADGYPVATHTPVLLEYNSQGLVGFGHVKCNEYHTTTMEQNEKVLLIFQGPNAYISASWYQNPSVASTWNYAAVHAEGVLTFIESELLEVQLRRTVAHFESKGSPASYDCLPLEYRNKQMAFIKGFEVQITHW